MKKIILIFLLFSLVFVSLEKKWGEKIIISFKEMGEREVLPIFKKIFSWLEEKIWIKTSMLLKTEYEKRRPQIEEEFKKEAEEIKKELPQFFKKIWAKISPKAKK